MRIALVHYAYAPVIGGVERVIEEHARLFVANGHEVTVFCQRGESANPRIRVHRIGDVAVLKAALATHEIVFVHNVMTMPFDPALSAALAAAVVESPRVRFVAWIHDVAAVNPDYFATPEAAPVELRSALPGWEYVAVSELRASQWQALTGAKCRVVPNGIEAARVLGLPENVARLAAEYSLLDGRLVLLHPARLLRRKNVECSIGIAAALKSRAPVALLVTGAADPHNSKSHEYALWLREECKRLGVEREVLFVGDHFAVEDAELAALYRLADALLFPSRSEGFGLPLLEAALARLPVFCSDIEPLRGLARGGTTFIPDDPIAASEIIHRQRAADPATLAKTSTLAHCDWAAIDREHLRPLIGANA